ncbi:MAG: 2-isopropylmalate synthase [Candidatus Omnitrophota bacterium]
MKRVEMPFKKYRRYPQVRIPDRTWPNKVISQAPTWCSIDLRDGNQALSVPMDIPQKMEMFDLLVSIGFKEIEVGFPSASAVEFDFIRKLIEEDRIPKDVTIQVITQAREDLIRRTFESIKGARRAIVHLYNSTSKVQREVVFGKSRAGIIKIATNAARLMAQLKKESGNSGIRFQYSSESFPGTELDFARDICQAVIDIWKPTVKDKIIINLPETVEMSTPNVYADRIEWFIRNVRHREAIIISVHTHNDRGTGVAAAELAVLAGAQRVEGALFGNGERTGNMDIVTMALNMFSQGVDPMLDFSNMAYVMDVYTRCVRMDIHARHPYVGELVYTAFSGSHQDAINKGMKARARSGKKVWEVPYLPIDPKDIGRSYESVIRINSQSGKGGVAYIMEKDWGIQIPKDMQRDFAKAVQAMADKSGVELSSQEIRDCFAREYLQEKGHYELASCEIHTENGPQKETVVFAVIRKGMTETSIMASGNGPIAAFVNGMKAHFKIPLDVAMFAEHALTKGANAEAVAYVGIKQGNEIVSFGAGVDPNISRASIKAVVSALNRR